MAVYCVSGVVLDDTGTGVAGRTVRMYRRDTGALLAYGLTVAAGASYDANFRDVLLLLHGDGAHNSTSVIDSSGYHRSAVNTLNVTISTANSMFGGSSIRFNTSQLNFPSYADMAFGAGDYTVEMGFTMSSAQQVLLDMAWDNPGVDRVILYVVSNTVRLRMNAIDRIVSAALTTDQFYHLAICRSGTNTKMFIDGTQTGSTLTGDSRNMSVGACTFGMGYSIGSYYIGYLDEVRITKGVARYTSNFTAPSAPHPDIGLSLPLGGYALYTDYSGEVDVVALDDAGGTTYNDRILRVTPT